MEQDTSLNILFSVLKPAFPQDQRHNHAQQDPAEHNISSLPISSRDGVIPHRAQGVGTRLIASLRPGHRFARLKDVGNGKHNKGDEIERR